MIEHLEKDALSARSTAFNYRRLRLILFLNFINYYLNTEHLRQMQ